MVLRCAFALGMRSSFFDYGLFDVDSHDIRIFPIYR